MKMEFSAGGIVYKKIYQDFQFALILDSYGKWTFPKGHIDKGEKPEEAALRETTEEIGLSQIKIITPIEKVDFWFKLNEELIHKYVYFYLIESDGTEELNHQIEEVQEAKWLSPQEAYNQIDYKKQNQPILVKAFKILGINCELDTKNVE